MTSEYYAMRGRFTVTTIPRLMVLMGVAGCGKSSVGADLAPLINASYTDGDDLHPQANIDKMSAGHPLTDEDRWPWLHIVGQTLGESNNRTIIGCSSLKRAYRDAITQAANAPVTFIHLSGSRAVIESRLSSRQGHFMPTALLDSQFTTLEAPDSTENAIEVDIDQPIDDIVSEIRRKLQRC